MLACWGLAGCGPQHHETTAIYQDIAAEARWDGTGELVKTYPNKAAVPQYVLEGGRLRLLIQVTQPGLFAIDVGQPEWNGRKLADLRSRHPELGAYLRAAKWPNAK